MQRMALEWQEARRGERVMKRRMEADWKIVPLNASTDGRGIREVPRNER